MENSGMEVVYQIFIGLVIPLVVSGLKQVYWPSSVKFSLVLLISLVCAAVVPIARLSSRGSFDVDEFLQSMTVIFTTTQIFYRTAFKMLNIEDKINPQAALLSAIQDQVSTYVSSIDLRTTRSLLDPYTDHSLIVEITDINNPDEDEDEALEDNKE